MANLKKRLERLEARHTDRTGLVPHSEEWFSYWAAKIDQVGKVENPDLRGLTLDILDAVRARYEDGH